MREYVCEPCGRTFEVALDAVRVCPYCGSDYVRKSAEQVEATKPSFSQVIDRSKSYNWTPSEPGTNPMPLTQKSLTEAVAAIEKAEEDEWRLKVVYVPERLLFNLFVLPTRVPGQVAVLDTEPPLPEDVEVLPGPYHDRERRCFVFYIRHPSFEPVPDGMIPPRWPVNATYRLVRTVPGV